MEDWQINHITKNIVKLVKNTNVNSDLLRELKAVDLLSDIEIEHIEAGKTRTDKVDLLYKILQTKTNAYFAIIRILDKYKQSGAAQILVGAIPFDVIKNIQIKLFAETFSVESRFDNNDIKELQLFLNKFMTTGEYLELLSNIPSTLTILRETIPPPISYYISRRLEKRTTIDPRLFRAACTDVFVFLDIDIMRLSRVAPPPNVPDISTRQLMEITTRFISLESSDHWIGLKRISRQPIHLIFRDEVTKSYKLEATMGRSKILRQFLVHSVDENVSENDNISEAEFIETCVNSSSICICDRPGMGKSVQLANIARIIKAKQEDKIVGFIQLSMFIDLIKGQPTLRKLTQANLKRFIFSVISTNKLGAAILLQLDSKQAFAMDLFFDGFDEVNDVKLALNLLSQVRNLPLCRIFVTSRSHMRYELEDALDILAFNISPFTTDDQVSCLVGIWKNEHSLSNDRKLIEFAGICLDDFNSIVYDNNNNITGIAFQCFLLADVHSAQACNYATIEIDYRSTELVVVRSLFDIYKKYVDIRFMRETCLEKRYGAKLFHAWHALKVVFPEIAQTFLKFHNLEEYSEFLIYGLLEEHHTGDILTYKFLHRTVAEYLVAEVIENALLDDVQCHTIPKLKPIIQYIYNTLFFAQKESKFVFNAFLLQPLCNGYKDRELVNYPDFDIYSFRFNVVLYFLNFRLGSRDLHKITSMPMAIRSILRYEMPIEHITKMLVGCVYHNFQFILWILEPFLKPSPNCFEKVLRQLSWFHQTLQSKVMLVAARYSDINTIEACASILHLYFDTTNKYVIAGWSNLSPISVAIQRGSFMLFQYFQNITQISSSIHHEFWRLNLRFCLGQSAKDSLGVVGEKLDIIKLIFHQSMHSNTFCTTHQILNAKTINCVPPPLVTSGIHIKLLKFLVENSAEICINDEFNDTILLQAATPLSPMSGDDYHELVIYLSEIWGARELFTAKNCEGIAPLYNAVENVTNLRMDTVKIIVELGGYSVTDFQTANKEKSLLFAALDGNQSRDIVEFFIRHGAYMIKHNNGSSCFISSDYLLHIISRQTIQSLIRELKDPATYTTLGAVVKACNVFVVDPIEIITQLNKVLESHFTKMVFSEGDTLVHIFAQCNPEALYALCKFLCKKKMSVAFEKRNNAGRTPLHEAVFCQNVTEDVIDLLVRNGGGINSLDQEGNSILRTALELRLDYRLVTLLKELGAKVDVDTC